MTSLTSGQSSVGVPLVAEGSEGDIAYMPGKNVWLVGSVNGLAVDIKV